MNHVLKEAPLDKAALEQEPHRIEQPRAVRWPELKWIADGQGADGSGVHQAVRRWGRSPRARDRARAGKREDPLEDRERGAVGTQFARWREKIPRAGLRCGEAPQHALDPMAQPDAEHGVQNERGVAKPEPLVR